MADVTLKPQDISDHQTRNMEGTMKMTLEEVKSKTVDILGADNIGDLNYITREYIESEFHLEIESNKYLEPDRHSESRTVIYGHQMFYCWHNNDYHYCYMRGANPGSDIRNACGNRKMRLPFSTWDHEVTNRDCPGSDRIVRFIRRSSEK